MAKHVIVVGGDAAGMSAASQIRRANPDMEVTVFEKSPYASYGACGMPYLISGVVDSAESLLALRSEDFVNRGIDVRLEHEVVAVKAGAHLVEVQRSNGSSLSNRYDYLVLATGGEPVVPAWADMALSNVFVLRGLHDGIAIRRFLDSGQVECAVIVGTGLLGVEMAEALLKRGLQVTLIGRSPHLLAGLDSDFLTPVLQTLTGHGLVLRQDQAVTDITSRDGRARSVVLADGEIATDMVLLAAGTAPATALARRAGADLGPSGGIQVSDRMKTGLPGVYAAGDCVEVTHVVTGARVLSPLALTANRTGRIAGDNLASESLGKLSRQRFRGTAGTTITQVFDHTVACTGLSQSEAEAAGFQTAVFERESRSRAAYYPGSEPVRTRIVVDRRTHRLLGGQMVGREGIAGRIDVLAAALFSRMTVQEIYDLDLAYAPPFGPVYDPIIDVCGRAALELGAL